MIRLYRKNPLFFAMLWIAGYIFLITVTDTVSAQIFGIYQVATLPALLIVALMLAFFVRNNGLSGRFGLFWKRGALSVRTLYLVPLTVIATSNLWGGVAINFPAHETAIIVLSMLLVGLIEEVIFRGILFRAIAAISLKLAVIASPIAFGLGHIINLLTEASLFETGLQIVYATSIGFLFTIIFLKTGTIIPCVAAHGIINALGAFAAPGNRADHSIQVAILIVLSLSYAIYLLKVVPGVAIQKK